MAEIITCSKCQRSLQIPEAYLGQMVQCPDCKHMFIATVGSVSTERIPAAPSRDPSPGRSPKSSGYDGEEEDDRPRRRRDRFGDDMDDDFDDIRDSRRIRSHLQPHRGGLIMSLGLVSLIGGWLFCLPILVGPVAWILAQMDLRAIRDGRMDPTGEGMVRTGQVCGIISTVILVAMVMGIGILILVEMKRF